MKRLVLLLIFLVFTGIDVVGCVPSPTLPTPTPSLAPASEPAPTSAPAAVPAPTTEQPTPTPSPTKPPTSKPMTPSPAPLTPTPTPTHTPVSIPTYSPPPPRPNTPFITKEDGMLFQDDFEDGMADGWSLERSWDITRENGNYVLSGSQGGFARPCVTRWSDYTIEAKIKLVQGGFHFNLREGAGARYILGFNVIPGSGDINLSKQITSDFFDLSLRDMSLEFNRWYKVRATLEGNNIKVYLDDKLVVNYIDNEIPILSGIFSFETFDGSLVYFDEISVTGTYLVQRAKWEKTGGPSGGLGYDVRIHPLDKNIMFVTDNPSGVNKSYDGGNTWAQRNKGITARTGASGDGTPVFCLTIDPNNPDIVWAGTQGMRGVYKSTDGGETWMKKDNGITEWHEITLRNFGIRPGDSNTIFAGAQIGTGIFGQQFDKSKGKIYKTVDGGENWRCVWEGDSLVRFVLFDPSNPDTMYASTGIFDAEAYNDVGIGILKSTDGGETWRQINNGLKNLFLGFLEMHPENPQILFAAAGCETYPNNSGIYMTTNGGQSWTQVLPSERPMMVVTVSPSNPEVVYAGGLEAFYRSDDGGQNWQKFWKEKEHCYGPEGVRAGFPISAVVDPNDPMTIFVNNYAGGVFKSVDGAKTWENCSTGYTGANIGDIALVSGIPDVVYAIAESGPFRSLNGGREWSGMAFDPAFRPDLGMKAIAVNQENPQEVFIGSAFQGALLHSFDCGNTWEIVFQHPVARHDSPGTGHGFSAITYAPSDPMIVYAGMKNSRDDAPSSYGIYKSIDGGKTWQEKNRGLEKSNKDIIDIVVYFRSPDIAYVATNGDGIFKTTNSGENWIAINNGLLSLQPASLAIHPENPDIVYAGLSEGVGIFKTTNGGQLWEAINFGIRVECPSFLQRVGQVQLGVSLEKPKRIINSTYYSIPWTIITSIVIDPVEPETLYAADTHLGVYMSTDGGESWTPINDGISMRAVPVLALSADGHILYAATQGGGIFRLELW